MRVFLAAATVLLTAISANASDWCDGADRSRLNAAERAICDTPALRSLDTTMANAFYARRDAASPRERERLIFEQSRTWLPYRNACGAQRRCLANRYTARIAELTERDLAAMGACTPETASDVTVTAEGYFERTDDLGIVRLFDPRTGKAGVRQSNGQIQWFQFFTQVNPVGLPALPGDMEDDSIALAFDVKTLSGMVLNETQLAALEPHAPPEYLGFMDFYINAMIYFEGLNP